MATLRQYFEKDFQHTLRQTATWRTRVGGLAVTVQLHIDFNASVRFVSFYVPGGLPEPAAIVDLLAHLDNAVNLGRGQVQVTGGVAGAEMTDADTLPFSGQVWVYCEDELSPGQENQVTEAGRRAGVRIHVRGPRMVVERSKFEKPLAFVSHDSADKATIAKPLVDELMRKYVCPTWYDEYTLRVGDNLRETVERGIRECRRGVVIVSKAYLLNTGWAKREFDSIFTKEMVEKRNVLLPVWVDVTPAEVFEFSASLPNVVALKWSDGLPEVARKIAQVLLQPDLK